MCNTPIDTLMLFTQRFSRMWEHRDLCPVCIHCIGGVHFREQLWEEEIHNPDAVLKPTDFNQQIHQCDCISLLHNGYANNYSSVSSILFFRNYVIMVTMFFTVSVINNYALNFNIAMPLHMIFRSVSICFSGLKKLSTIHN